MRVFLKIRGKSCVTAFYLFFVFRNDGESVLFREQDEQKWAHFLVLKMKRKNAYKTSDNKYQSNPENCIVMFIAIYYLQYLPKYIFSSYHACFQDRS